MGFSKDFIWGVATAAYQIEGAPYKAGGGVTVWDMFAKKPGATHHFESGEVACDHYNRYQDDVNMMSELGIPNYRLSISWARVMPDGTGKVSEEGLGFYDKLVDSLLEKGINPFITLYHWDMPIGAYHRGGWLNRECSDWFADYTKVIMDRLSDRVSNWMTLNEPQCFIGLGLQSGQHAPGDRHDFPQVLHAAHNALLAHGKAAQVIRANAKKAPRIGWAPYGGPKIPLTNSPEDIEAARQKMFGNEGKSLWSNSWWSDPVFFGHYPEDALAAWADDLPEIKPGDMETIKQEMDFYGVNVYNAQTVKMGEDGKPEELLHPTGIGRTIYHWPVTPECLYWGPRFFYERYKKPVIITENGIGLGDWIMLDGQVHDPARIDYLHRHLSALKRAADDGVPVHGYFQWSLMDNFEWQEGYKHRFGLVHVDYQTQKRTPKDSAYWYKEVIRTNGENL